MVNGPLQKAVLRLSKQDNKINEILKMTDYKNRKQVVN